MFASCVIRDEPSLCGATCERLRWTTLKGLAAVCNDPVGNLNPAAAFEINHRVSARVAEKPKTADVRRVPFWSRRGDIADVMPVSEVAFAEGSAGAEELHDAIQRHGMIFEKLTGSSFMRIKRSRSAHRGSAGSTPRFHDLHANRTGGRVRHARGAPRGRARISREDVL